ncbi:complement component C9 [Lepisosteus oculatus]|uniref:complement component C9 n=1 Tax=Lepisosteus oculatus TaxID=7918 RepID=UPI00371518D3
MKTLAVLSVILCLLQGIILVDGGDFMDNSKPLQRMAREVGAPAQVDCKLSTWSPWSKCDPCSKQMFRARSVEVFGQFGGQTCFEPLGQKKACTTDDACDRVQPECSETEFRCESGTCIKKRLECNGDNDCGDLSDEDCEEPHRPPCGKSLVDLSELGRTAGYGINILGSHPRANPFNNEFFNGVCNRVRDPSTREYNRIPWNVVALTYATLTEESFSKDIFEEASTLVRELLTEKSISADAGFSFKFSGSPKEEGAASDTGGGFKGGVNVDSSEKIKTINEYSTVKTKSFMRVKGKIQLSTFRMRSRDLRLSDTFLDDLIDLPLEYSKSRYFDFLEDYGTHYTVSGTAGGKYDLVYVMDKETLKTSRMKEEEIKKCLGFDASVDFKTSGVDLDLHAKPKFCNNLKTGSTATNESTALLEKVISFVSGGTPASTAALKRQIEKEGVMDVNAYVEWARSLDVAPVLVTSKPEAIYNLVPLTMTDANKKKANLEAAINDYIEEYNVCKCKPCQNGGTVTLIDGDCLCLCLPKFEGIACQNRKSEAIDSGTVVQEGNWACWSSWSACAGGHRTRSRICNTEGLSKGSCKGEQVKTDYC